MPRASTMRIFALALRIFRQFTRDRRTMALVFILPIIVMVLVSYLLEGQATRIKFALVEKGAGDSIVYDILHSQLEEESRITMVNIAPEQVQTALRDGRIAGALVVAGGGLEDMRNGESPSLDLYLEGSDALATRELVSILARVNRGLLPAVRDVVNVFGSDSDMALASIEIKDHYLYGGPDFTATDYFAPIILGVFPFVLTFLLTSVSFLRERTSGTMERLLASPIGRVEVIAGYLLGFLIFTLLQAAIVLGFILYVLDVYHRGSTALLFIMVTLITISASGLGMFLSSFARTELQVAQFMPLFMLPIVLVSGVLWPVETMPKWLWPLSYASPLTWAIFVLRDIMIRGMGLGGVAMPAGILCLFSIGFILLAAASIRRQLD